MLSPLRRYALMTLVLATAAAVSFVVIGGRMIAGAPAPVASGAAGLAAEDVAFTGSRGVLLHGWLVPAAQPAAAVVLMHGLGEDRRAMLDRAQFLNRAGHAVLLFDFQGHGDSDGGTASFGLFESYDAAAAVAFMRERYPGVAVVALGRSLGGAACLLAQPPLDVDGMIVESTWPSLEAWVAGKLTLRFGTFGDLLTGPFVAQTEWRLGIDADMLRPIARASAVQAPVLLMSGAEDPTATSRQTLFLYAQLARPDGIWLVGAAAQQDLHAFAPAEYEQRVLRFIGKVSSGAARP